MQKNQNKKICAFKNIMEKSYFGCSIKNGMYTKLYVDFKKNVH